MEKTESRNWEHKLWGEENIKELKITEFDVYSKKLILVIEVIF